MKPQPQDKIQRGKKGLLSFMIFMILWLVFLQVPVIGLAQSGPSFQSGPGGTNRPQNFQQRGREMLEELGLTEEQKQKIKELQGGFQESSGNKRDAMRALHEKMKNAMEGSASDEELMNLHEEMQKAQWDVKTDHFKQMLKIRGVLTPEQRKKFKGFGAPKGQNGRGGQQGMGGHQGQGQGQEQWQGQDQGPGQVQGQEQGQGQEQDQSW